MSSVRVAHALQENNLPISVFDSGIGGLSVLKEITKLMPRESINYFADSGNCPYGSKSKTETISLSKKNIEFLLKQKCKIIVVACNTATATAIDTLRNEYPVPFIGMEPAVKPASLYTKTKKIGILATQNTFNGNLFKNTFEKYASQIKVYVQPGHGLVELVESGNNKSKKTENLLKKYIEPMIENGVDTLVLGCTHYPFLNDLILKITDNKIKIFDPASAVAAQTKRKLTEQNMLTKRIAPPEYNFFTTGKINSANNLILKMTDKKFNLNQIHTGGI